MLNRRSNEMINFSSKPKRNLKVQFTKTIQIEKENQDQYFDDKQKRSIHKISRVVEQLMINPISTHNSIILQMKCLMTKTQIHQSYLIPKRLINGAKSKLIRANQLIENTNYSEDCITKFLQIIVVKPNDSSIVVEAYKNCINAYQYPPSIKMLLMYMGIFLYSINAMYDMAEETCRQFFNMVVRVRVDEYFLIHLIMLVKIKANLCQWSQAIKILMKLLTFSWIYRLIDLQIWCYFQLSRAYFFNNQITECQFFRKKSEMNIIQPQGTLFREIIEKELKDQIESIKEHNYYFDLEVFLPISRLKPPPLEAPQIQNISKRNLQTIVKQVNEDCKIRYVKNLLPKIVHKSQSNSIIHFSGNPHFTTHNSRIKNMNMYFRFKKAQINKPYKLLYTVQNSTKSWTIIKEMIKNIIIEMRLMKENA